MSKNVMIPLSLLESMIELLVELDIPEYHELRYEYGNILWALQVKKQKLQLRESYAKIIAATDVDERDEARIQYLWRKNSIALKADLFF